MASYRRIWRGLFAASGHMVSAGGQHRLAHLDGNAERIGRNDVCRLDRPGRECLRRRHPHPGHRGRYQPHSGLRLRGIAVLITAAFAVAPLTCVRYRL